MELNVGHRICKYAYTNVLSWSHNSFRLENNQRSVSLLGNRVEKVIFEYFFYFSATSVTWTAPPPQFTQTVSTDIRTVDLQVLNGSTQVPLRWSYTLSSGSLILTSFSMLLNDGSFDGIGTISGGNPTVFNKKDYRTRFDISRSEVATLIINTVTEREERVYQCQLITDSNQWKYRIRVIVTGERCNVYCTNLIYRFSQA